MKRSDMAFPMLSPGTDSPMRENNAGEEDVKEALSITAGRTINLPPEPATRARESNASTSKTADTTIIYLLPCESAKAPATIGRKPAKTLLTVAKRPTSAGPPMEASVMFR